MNTLLLRLAGPMQSWGTQSRFTMRDTGLEPSKSGVIGLLCAALGRPRTDSVVDLAALRMGVRVDREGIMKMDYHTAGGAHRVGEKYGVAKADGSPPGTVTSRRYYLADGDFLVGLEGENEHLLRELLQALAAPHWQLFLGRKSFVPGVPVYIGDGLKEGLGLEDALKSYLPRPRQVRLVLETPSGEEVRQDQPVGAAFRERSFALRRVTVTFHTLDGVAPAKEA